VIFGDISITHPSCKTYLDGVRLQKLDRLLPKEKIAKWTNFVPH
jgi:hypothetical protein